MNKKILLSLSLILSSGLVSKGNAQESSPIEAYDQKTIGKIEIKLENLPEGASFDRQAVLSKLKTRQGDPFSQYVFDQDLKKLASDYDRVEPVVHVESGEVDITLKVWLRPIINKIEWEGNSAIKTRTLRKELDIKPGMIFNRTDFNKAFNKVKDYYIKKGYFESQLSYRLLTDPKTKEVDIIINVSEGHSGKVEDIVFHGLTSEEESAILDKLYTRKYSTLTSWFTGKGKFMEEALEQDRLTIFNYLQDQGYADARVEIKLIPSEKTGKIIIDIAANKGALYHFGQVSFNGNILFTDEEVERVFIAHPDAIYSPEKLRKTADAIKDLYGRKGYIDASVTYETQLLEDSPTYNVHFSVDEGREYRIGMIRIIGNSATESRVILRESLLVPGETFDSLKLKVTQARLENMGYFKSVNVYAVRTQDDLSLGENYRDIYIEVQETQTGNISLFGGFSSVDKVFGGLDLTERNFNYRGIGRVLSEGLSAVRGGGEFLHMRSSLGEKQQQVLVSWLTPYFLDSPWRVGLEFNANINSKVIKPYEITTYNVAAYLNYPLSPYLSYGFKYRIRNFDNTIEKEFIIAQNEEKNPTRSSGILSGLGTSLGYDSTNSAVKPTRGLRTALEGEVVGLGGNASFFRTAWVNAYYTPLWKRGYMRYRADFRFIYPFGKTPDFEEIPLSERFFLGGVASVRGYKNFSLGPPLKKIKIKEKTSKDNYVFEIEDTNDPSGGISSSFLSVDYIQEILPILDAFVFIDAGFVNNKTFSFGTYQMSYGVGVNIDLMGKMPVTLGYGIPINPRKGQEEHFFFSLGGNF